MRDLGEVSHIQTRIGHHSDGGIEIAVGLGQFSDGLVQFLAHPRDIEAHVLPYVQNPVLLLQYQSNQSILAAVA